MLARSAHLNSLLNKSRRHWWDHRRGHLPRLDHPDGTRRSCAAHRLPVAAPARALGRRQRGRRPVALRPKRQPYRPSRLTLIVLLPLNMLICAHGWNNSGTVRQLVRRPGLGPTAAPDGDAGRRPFRRKRPADRPHRRRQDPRRLPAQPDRFSGQPASRPAHDLCQPAEGAGHRHRPQPDPAGTGHAPAHPPWRPEPATPPPTGGPANGPNRRTSC